MISLLPTDNETIVLPRSGEDTYRRLLISTSEKTLLQHDEIELLFSGWVLPDRFRITLRARRPNHFQPLVTGKIETTSTGCILFLRYRLFPMTRILVQLWTLLLVLGMSMTGYSSGSYTPVLIGLSILAVIYMVAWSNFWLHKRTTRDAIHRVVA